MKYNCVIFNDTSFEYHHGSICVMDVLKSKLKENFNIIKTFPCYEFDDASNVDKYFKKNIQKYLISIDIIIVNGEGTIHDDQSRALKLLKVINNCKKINKDIILLNCSIENMTNESLNYLRQINKIFVRDLQTLNYLSKNNIKSEYVPDLIFSISYNKQKKLKKN